MEKGPSKTKKQGKTALPFESEKRFRLELMRGGAIQRRFMRQNSDTGKRVKARFYNRMAYELGGDFYRFSFIEEDYCLAGCFDVAGKDLSAALVASALAAFFETLQLFKIKRKAEAINRSLNTLVRALCPEDIFVAAALVYADFKKRRAEIYNFGFPPVYVFTGKDRPLEVPAAYPPLGIEEKTGAKKGFVMPLKK
ncbi:MAG: serine/threonine-protein phosphatase, partial [Spirochaetaceae bacterium]|nr:serine/threonine-protein phosphatase [Spirochaetaceae bacterium]